MGDELLERERVNKFNDWGKREPIGYDDSEKCRRAMAIGTRRDLSDAEKSAKYVSDMTGCRGFEFVVFLNAKIDSPICLADTVILFPCFLPETELHTLQDPKTQASIQMSRTARYIYDGWIHIPSMVEDEIRSKIRILREVASAFVLVPGSKFEWEPKYQVAESSDSTYYPGKDAINNIESFFQAVESGSKLDRAALLRSIGWLSQSICIENPESKFLFSVFAIESLCAYIEQAKDNSVFSSLRGSRKNKAERKTDREACIKETLEQLICSNPTKAIEDAYFDCVQGIKKRLQEHLNRVMGKDDEGVTMLFDKANGLYGLRNKIAHGTHDLLSEEDRLEIGKNVSRIEKFATRYIWKILHEAFGFYNSSGEMKASFVVTMTNSARSSRPMYRGPVDMGLLYVK